MDSDTDIILQLVAGQSRIEQAVKDVDKRLDIAFPAIATTHKELEKRVRSVEAKQWYFGGAGTILGGLLTFLGEHYKLLGGK
jgi:hypothetical protein